MKKGSKKIGTKYTDKFSAIVLSIIFFANVQGGEDEDPGGFGSLVNAEPGGIVVRPDMDFKEKSQRYNDANGLFLVLSDVVLQFRNSRCLANQI